MAYDEPQPWECVRCCAAQDAYSTRRHVGQIGPLCEPCEEVVTNGNFDHECPCCGLPCDCGEFPCLECFRCNESKETGREA